MKKTLSLILTVILFATAVLPAAAMSTESYVQLVHISHNVTMDVQKSTAYDSLEQAVKDAVSGDIIEVFDNLTVSSPITIPENTELTIVSGTKRTSEANFGRDVFEYTDQNAVKRTVKKNFSGSLFTLGKNSKVTFENITLDGNGKSGTKGGLVYCKSGSSLNLKRGAVLKNSALGTDSYGGAVYAEKDALVSVDNTVVFSGNTASHGKDIYAEIKENLSLLPGATAYTSYGGCKTHTPKTTLTKATLTKNGKVVSSCGVCGAVIKTSTVYYPKTFTLSATKYTYTGKAVKPAVTVKDSAGKTVSASNYTLKYSNNTNVGTAKVTVTFKGNYSGTKTLTFTIIPKQVTGLKASAVKKDSIKLTWSKAGGAKYYKLEQSTDGKKWTKLTVTDKLSYTVSKLKAGGKYQYRVTAYDSTKKLAGKVSAVLKTGTLTAAPSVTLKSSKSKTATATWKKVTGASKYTVYKSTNNKTWTKVTTTTKLTYSLTKLSGGKKIYVKVNAVNAYGKTSAYSSVKYVTVKK